MNKTMVVSGLMGCLLGTILYELVYPMPHFTIGGFLLQYVFGVFVVGVIIMIGSVVFPASKHLFFDTDAE